MAPHLTGRRLRLTTHLEWPDPGEAEGRNKRTKISSAVNYALLMHTLDKVPLGITSMATSLEKAVR